MSGNLNDYADVHEAAEALGIHAEHTRRLFREGRMGAFKFAGKWVVERKKLEAFAKLYNPKQGVRWVDG